jgi:hypothetical protein
MDGTILSQPPGIGHNGGPPLDEPLTASWHLYCWRKAHRRAWKTPPREIALARLARAEELGMTYRQYTAIILDTGKHL